MKKILVLSLVLIITAMVGFACSGDSPTATTPPTSTTAPTATTMPTPTSAVMEPTPTEPAMDGEGDPGAGQTLATSKGCLACHSIDGTVVLGPSWLSLYGSTETITGGTTVMVDDAYLEESIVTPGAKVVQGFQNIMPAGIVTNPAELLDIIAYIKSLS